MVRRCVLGSLLAAALVAPSLAQQAALPAAPHVAVVGRGVVEAPPDFAEITFGIGLAAESVEQAKADVDARVNRLLETLGRFEVPLEHVEATELTIEPHYDYRENGVVLLGYNVRRAVELRLTDLDQFNDLLDQAVRSGVTEFYGASIRSNDEETLRRTARARAVADARAQATEMAEAFGETLGPIYSAATSQARQANQRIFGDPGDAGAVFKPGPIEITETVHAVFLLGAPG